MSSPPLLPYVQVPMSSHLPQVCLSPPGHFPWTAWETPAECQPVPTCQTALLPSRQGAIPQIPILPPVLSGCSGYHCMKRHRDGNELTWVLFGDRLCGHREKPRPDGRGQAAGAFGGRVLGCCVASGRMCQQQACPCPRTVITGSEQPMGSVARHKTQSAGERYFLRSPGNSLPSAGISVSQNWTSCLRIYNKYSRPQRLVFLLVGKCLQIQVSVALWIPSACMTHL